MNKDEMHRGVFRCLFKSLLERLHFAILSLTSALHLERAFLSERSDGFLFH